MAASEGLIGSLPDPFLEILLAAGVELEGLLLIVIVMGSGTLGVRGLVGDKISVVYDVPGKVVAAVERVGLVAPVVVDNPRVGELLLDLLLLEGTGLPDAGYYLVVFVLELLDLHLELLELFYQVGLLALSNLPFLPSALAIHH